MHVCTCSLSRNTPPWPHQTAKCIFFQSSREPSKIYEKRNMFRLACLCFDSLCSFFCSFHGGGFVDFFALFICFYAHFMLRFSVFCSNFGLRIFVVFQHLFAFSAHFLLIFCSFFFLCISLLFSTFLPIIFSPFLSVSPVVFRPKIYSGASC